MPVRARSDAEKVAERILVLRTLDGFFSTAGLQPRLPTLDFKGTPGAAIYHNMLVDGQPLHDALVCKLVRAANELRSAQRRPVVEQLSESSDAVMSALFKLPKGLEQFMSFDDCGSFAEIFEQTTGAPPSRVCAPPPTPSPHTACCRKATHCWALRSTGGGGGHPCAVPHLWGCPLEHT